MTVAHLATTTLAVSILIVIVLAIRGPVARRYGPNMAYALWLIPAVRLVMPPLPASLSPFRWLEIGSQRPDVSAAALAAPERTPAPLVTPSSPTQEPGVWASTFASSPDMDTVAGAAAADAPVAIAPSLFEALPWAMIGGGALLATIALYYGTILFRQARFARLVAMEAEPAPAELADMAEMVRDSLGIRRKVAVKVSFLPSSPMVMGALRPTIVVPAWFQLDYTATEQRLALVHEMAHVKRGDLWALHAAHLMLALQWFNPLAHLALRAFRADQEAACDAMVLRRGEASPHAYGATLLKSVKLMRPAPQLQVAGLTLDHGLKERFQRMGWEGGQVSWIGKGVAAALGTLMIVASASTVAAHGENALMGGPSEIEVLSEEDGVRVVRINRRERMILAGDPFEDMHRELAKLDGLEHDMEPPEALTQPPVPPVPPAPPLMGDHALNLQLDLGDLEGKFVLDNLGQLRDLAALGALEALGDSDFQISTSPDGQSVTISGDGLHLSLTGFDEAAFEAGMNAFEMRMESFEAEMEAYAEQIEAEAERFAARIEARVEAVVDGPAFERATADGETVIEDLSEQCGEALETGARAVVVESEAPHSGKTYRAICLGEGDALSPSEYDAFVEAHPDLSEAAKDALRNGR